MEQITPPFRVAPAAEAPLTEQVSSLIPRRMRAYLLGCVEADQARGEGVVIRSLLASAIERLAAADPAEHQRRVELGEAELVWREQQRSSRSKPAGAEQSATVVQPAR